MSLAGVGIALRERLDDVSERMALRLQAEVESYFERVDGALRIPARVL